MRRDVNVRHVGKRRRNVLGITDTSSLRYLSFILDIFGQQSTCCLVSARSVVFFDLGPLADCSVLCSMSAITDRTCWFPKAIPSAGPRRSSAKPPRQISLVILQKAKHMPMVRSSEWNSQAIRYHEDLARTIQSEQERRGEGGVPTGFRNGGGGEQGTWDAPQQSCVGYEPFEGS